MVGLMENFNWGLTFPHWGRVVDIECNHISDSNIGVTVLKMNEKEVVMQPKMSFRTLPSLNLGHLHCSIDYTDVKSIMYLFIYFCGVLLTLIEVWDVVDWLVPIKVIILAFKMLVVVINMLYDFSGKILYWFIVLKMASALIQQDFLALFLNPDGQCSCNCSRLWRRSTSWNNRDKW